MRLTTFTDYSLRTLICLAVRDQSTIAEISRLYGISETHLNKVIHQLDVAGEIETIRGRDGGIRLARPPETINFGTVVRRTEDLALVTCLESGACLIAPACMLQTALKEALAAFLAVFDRYTIADLASSPALARFWRRRRHDGCSGLAAGQASGALRGTKGDDRRPAPQRCTKDRRPTGRSLCTL